MRHRYDPWPGQTLEREDPTEWEGQSEWENPLTKPVGVWNFFPLPPSETNRFMRALFRLEVKAFASNDARRWRYLCWLNKLKQRDADDRVIPWSLICPKGGTKVAGIVVGSCDLTTGVGWPVNTAEIKKRIQSISDVDAVGQSLGIIRYVKPSIVVGEELLPDFSIEAFRRLHDDVRLAIKNLRYWANPPLGGGSGMPKAYVSIKDWIGQQMRNSRSVYSCQ